MFKADVPQAPKLTYTPEAMVQLMLDNPSWSRKQLANAFGQKEGWLSSVLASERFQRALEPVRQHIHNPELAATMEERVRAVAMRSMDVILEKLDSDEASENLALQAASLGIKGLGMGQIEKPKAPEQIGGTVESLADRLVAALEKQRNNSRLNVLEMKDGAVVPSVP